jgi:drug/metabolite transporter (DMT)-like permease
MGAYRGGGAVRQRRAIPAVRGSGAGRELLQAGIINATTPLWTVVLALAVRHQKTVTSWQAAGLIIGFCGAVLIFTPRSTAAGLISAGGLECLAASVSYAISYIYMDKFLARRGIGPVVLSACQLLATSVMLAVALAVTGVRTPHVTTVSLAAVAVLGIVGTGFAYVLNYQIITSEGATIASTVTYLLPVVAIVLGGIALVLAGVGLTRRNPKPAIDGSDLFGLGKTVRHDGFCGGGLLG